ncbi:MAG: hypothetical protein Kow00129_07670 [Thermoleophilia bacterium]
MIVSVVTFRLQHTWTVDQAATVFRSTAPKYRDVPGLIQKHYFLAEDGTRAGGIYFWRSRDDAQACYTQDWVATVTEKYGSAPEISYLTVPVSVDNERGVIEAR